MESTTEDMALEAEEDTISEAEEEYANRAILEQKCIKVPLEKLKPFSGVLYDEDGNETVFSGNPFSVPENYWEKTDKDSEYLKQLQASIQQDGLLTPLLVRVSSTTTELAEATPSNLSEAGMKTAVEGMKERKAEKTGKAEDVEDVKYEILSGYRRKAVCEQLAKTDPSFNTISVIVIDDCDDDTAASIITSANVQRKEISLLDTIKSCGRMYRALLHRRRKKNTTDEKISEVSSDISGRLGSSDSSGELASSGIERETLTQEIVSQITGLKPRTVRRYSTLLELPEGLLELAGTKAKTPSGELRLPIAAGEVLATMHGTKLEVIENVLFYNEDKSISVKQAQAIKRFCRKKPTVTEKEIERILKQGATKTKPNGSNGSSKRRFTLDNERIKKYCGNMTDQEVEKLLYDLIEQWGENTNSFK